MLSGLKHFAFCRRRWALVHIEQLWKENVLTLDGHYMHERVHDAGFTESRGSTLLSRAMPIRSQALRITGECDMVELHRDPAGVPSMGETVYGDYIPLSTNAENPIRAAQTNCSSVHRQCVWKKCSSLTFQRELCIMAKPVVV